MIAAAFLLLCCQKAARSAKVDQGDGSFGRVSTKGIFDQGDGRPRGRFLQPGGRFFRPDFVFAVQERVFADKSADRSGNIGQGTSPCGQVSDRLDFVYILIDAQ